ncbi:hypothetical protein MNEG_15801, partial [Monoraphidium neglectum]
MRRCRCAPVHERAAAAAAAAAAAPGAWGPAPVSARGSRHARAPAPQPLRAGADAQAFESLLAGAGDDDNRRPSARPGAPAAAVGIGSQSKPADEAEDEETSSLLPPVLPLHRGAERFAWAAPDGTLLEVIRRQGVPQGDDAAAGGPGAVAVE